MRDRVAVVVSAGLIVSTALTLLVVPAVYSVVPSTVRTRVEEEELRVALAEAERVAAAPPSGSPTSGEGP